MFVLIATVHYAVWTMSNTIPINNRCHKLYRITKFHNLMKQLIKLYRVVNFNCCEVNTWRSHKVFALLECYTACVMCSGAAYRFHCQGSRAAKVHTLLYTGRCGRWFVLGEVKEPITLLEREVATRTWGKKNHAARLRNWTDQSNSR